MKNITPELIAQARAAKSAEELKAIAIANNIALTDREIRTYFDQLHNQGFVNDDELELVAGGEGCGDDNPAGDGAKAPGKNGSGNGKQHVGIYR